MTGPSGSGKSTVLNALAGLVPRVEGRVVVAGRVMNADDSAGNAQRRRNKIGSVFQQGLLVPELNARDNVALPLRLPGAGKQLSGGQRQRVAVARAVVHRRLVMGALVLASIVQYLRSASRHYSKQRSQRSGTRYLSHSAHCPA